MSDVTDGATAATPAGERQELGVSWLELFFDLAFVVAISALTGRLEGSPSLPSLFADLWLLVLLWLAWFNEASLTNLARGQDVLTRSCVFVSMAGVGVLAVGVPDAFGGRSGIFAAGYSIARLALSPVWIRARVQHHLDVVRPILYGPALSLVWLLSAFVPHPYQQAIWVVLMLIELGIVATRANGSIDAWRFEPHHLVERMGQFILITFGESVALLIGAVSVEPTPHAWLHAALGFVLLATLFATFYALTLERAEYALGGRPEKLGDFFGSGQFSVLAGLVAVAATNAELVEAPTPNALRLLAAGVALFMMGIASLSFDAFRSSVRTLDQRRQHQPRFGQRWLRVTRFLVNVVLFPGLVFALAGWLPAWAAVVLLTLPPAQLTAAGFTRSARIREIPGGRAAA